MGVIDTFGYKNMGYKVAVVWLLSFITVWIVFENIIPRDSILLQLNKIEESIQDRNWNEAKTEMNILKDTYKKNRLFVQMNNATEIFTTFEHTLGQLEITVKHEQEAAIEYVGALKETLNLVMKPFSGP